MGRWKIGGPNGQYYDGNDSGPDQVPPPVSSQPTPQPTPQAPPVTNMPQPVDPGGFRGTPFDQGGLTNAPPMATSAGTGVMPSPGDMATTMPVGPAYPRSTILTPGADGTWGMEHQGDQNQAFGNLQLSDLLKQIAATYGPHAVGGGHAGAGGMALGNLPDAINPTGPKAPPMASPAAPGLRQGGPTRDPSPYTRMADFGRLR